MASSPSLPLFLLFSSHLILLTVHPLHTPPPDASAHPPSPPSCGPGQSWAVRLHTHLDEEGHDLDELAHRVAKEVGLENRGQIGQLEGHYLLCQGQGDEGGTRMAGKALAVHPHVAWHSQELLLSRSKRNVAFNDPKYPKQWHLVSKGDREPVGIIPEHSCVLTNFDLKKSSHMTICAVFHFNQQLFHL